MVAWQNQRRLLHCSTFPFRSTRIDVEHNYSADDGLTSTWCLYEAAEPITEAEYREAFEKAIEHPEVVFH